MSPSPPRKVGAGRGMAMVALFVIDHHGPAGGGHGPLSWWTAAKNTVEVRGVRALMAAQSGLEIALYQLFPNRSGAELPAACTRVAASRHHL